MVFQESRRHRFCPITSQHLGPFYQGRCIMGTITPITYAHEISYRNSRPSYSFSLLCGGGHFYSIVWANYMELEHITYWAGCSARSFCLMMDGVHLLQVVPAATTAAAAASVWSFGKKLANDAVEWVSCITDDGVFYVFGGKWATINPINSEEDLTLRLSPWMTCHFMWMMYFTLCDRMGHFREMLLRRSVILSPKFFALNETRIWQIDD